tara:strand:- start:812 stop:1927 length:1116 start_codon:yes stop_codon:yes gene_type:complete
MSTTKITTPELLDFPDETISSQNTSGTVIPTGFTAPTVDVEYLVVAGGGGGGGYSNGGGGGAGGLLTNYGTSSLSRSASVAYDIEVGAGGIKGAYADGAVAGSGGNSKFDTIESNGGGGGVATGSSGQSGGSGGSGGGGGYNTNQAGGAASPAGQGNAGGTGGGAGGYYPGAGGGGAGAVGGTPANNTSRGDGGDGLEVNIIGGTGNYYAGGGGGGLGGGGLGPTSGAGGAGGLGGGGQGRNDDPIPAVAATAGTDGLGGGGGGGSTVTGPKDGGTGVVILRIPSTATATFNNATTTLTQVGGGTWTSGDKVYTIEATTAGADVTFTSTSSVNNIRPTTNLNAGEFRFNTTLNYVEYYNGSDWVQIMDSAV